MKIVILDMLNHIITEKQWSVFDVFENVIKYDNTSRDETIDRIKDADAIITNKVFLGKSELDAAKNLKYIGVVATGYNVVDVQYAKEKGKKICTMPIF